MPPLGACPETAQRPARAPFRRTGWPDAPSANLPAVALGGGLPERTAGQTPPREATRAPAVLEKNANRVSTLLSEGQRNARRLRFALRDGLRELTTIIRVEKCGRCRVAERVEVRRAGGRAHFNGITSCGSVWACPVCAAKIAYRRTDEITRTLEKHFAAGGGVEMMTFTLPHTTGDSLKGTRKLTADAFKRVQQGRAWLALKQDLGIVGSIRALEVTHGKNGWHPHLHPLFLTERPLTALERERLRAHCFRAWRAAVVKAGHAAPQAFCTTIQPIVNSGIADYCTKLGAALELTQGAAKTGRSKESRTAFGILQDFLTHGDADDLALWQEWERDMKGARQLTWSKGLKARYGVDDLTDEAVAMEADTAGEVLGVITKDEWRVVVAIAGLRVQILEAAERGGAAAVDRVLATLRLPPPS